MQQNIDALKEEEKAANGAQQAQESEHSDSHENHWWN